MLTAALLAGCQSLTPAQSLASAQHLAADHGFAGSRIDSGRFELMTYHRVLERDAQRLVVYIEGDGRAFVSRRRVSGNPTPRDPVALEMALADPSAAVAYIARPCQFIDPLPAGCEPRFWTTHRYSSEIIESISGAIDTLLADSRQSRLGLVGYSGGGVVAALLAQRRGDVDWLVTVAANLDHAAWTTWHGDTPLSGSLNPAADPQDLGDLPQLHLVGGEDDTVPVDLTAAFIRRLPDGTPAELMVIEDAGHHDWPAIWKERVCGLAFWRETAGCRPG